MINKQTDSHKGDILIVDDDLPSLSTLSSMLTTEGYEVRGVPDGQMALTVIDNKPPELILLDIKMPGMDGFEVCRQIKADEKSSGIPILFLSALDELKDKVKGFTVGAVDFITKPFQAEEVLTRVDTHLTLSRLSKNLEEQVVERTAEIKQYKHIVESTNNPIGLVDRNFIYQYVNDPYCQALKKSVNEIIGHSVPELFGRKYFETVMEHHYKQCFAGENVDFQEWFEFPGWGRRYMDVRYYPFREADGRITAVVTNVHDITEIKNLELKLKKSEELFRSFMDHNPAVAFIKNASSKHIYGNQSIFDAFDTSPDQFIGTTTDDFFPADIAEKIKAYDKEVLAGRIIEESEEFWDETRGQRRWWKEVKFPFTDYSGETMIGGLAFNITKIKQAEEKLKKAYNEIKELKNRIEQENIYLREEIEVRHRHEEIIGKSNPVMEMLSRAEQVAETDATVLLLGETGTGKELLARAIHRMSSRKDRPMVKVNCGSLPATLIESELFGREKGAYTGALAKQVGRFEIADGSTIFLDEIGDLPIDLQVKLLRVLQEGQFERLGSSKTISVNSRVIAATNRNLTAALQEGRFREDLFYRLNVFPITVPPLRERQEDIPLLVSAFVREFEAKMAKKIETISQKSINALQGYPWPGNVRELRNVIEQAMIISKGRTLVIREPAVSKPLKHKLYKLDDVERNHILKTLEATGWRIKGKQGTAEILGLKPSTLHFRMKKLGIQRPSFSVNISS
jgi:PAS domain S-box-containing protein